MAKMNELSMLAKEIQETGEKLIRISEEITGLFTATEDEATTEDPKPEAPAVTLEDVRAVLARKTRVSKENTEAIRKLLVSHGAQRLSEVQPEDYAAILKEAEVIPDA